MAIKSKVILCSCLLVATIMFLWPLSCKQRSSSLKSSESLLSEYDPDAQQLEEIYTISAMLTQVNALLELAQHVQGLKPEDLFSLNLVNINDSLTRLIEIMSTSSSEKVRRTALENIIKLMQNFNLNKIIIKVPQGTDKLSWSAPLQVGQEWTLSFDQSGQQHGILNYFYLAKPQEHGGAKICNNYFDCSLSMDLISYTIAKIKSVGPAKLNQIFRDLEVDINKLPMHKSYHVFLTLKLKVNKIISDIMLHSNLDSPVMGVVPVASSVEINKWRRQLIDQMRIFETYYVDDFQVESLNNDFYNQLINDVSEDLYPDKIYPTSAALDPEVIGKAKTYRDDLISTYYSLKAHYELLERFNEPDPRAWLQKILDRSSVWRNLFWQVKFNPETRDQFSNKNPNTLQKALHPLIAFHALTIYATNEMRLPFRDDWWQTIVRIEALLPEDSDRNVHFKDKRFLEIIGQLLLLRRSTDALIQQFFHHHDLPTNLISLEKDLATNMSGFNSWFYEINVFNNRFERYIYTNTEFNQQTKDWPHREKANREKPIVKKLSEATRSLQNAALRFKCYDHMIKQKLEFTDIVDELKVQEYQLEDAPRISCFDSIAKIATILGFKKPHNNQPNHQCINQATGTVSWNQLCGSVLSAPAINTAIDSCLKQQDNYLWCQEKTTVTIVTGASILTLVASSAVPQLLGVQGVWAHILISALSLHIMQRGVFAALNLQKLYDPSKSWSQNMAEHYRDLAITTAFFLFFHPALQAIERIALAAATPKAAQLARDISLTQKLTYVGVKEGGMFGLFMATDKVSPYLLASQYGQKVQDILKEHSATESLVHTILMQATFAALMGKHYFANLRAHVEARKNQLSQIQLYIWDQERPQPPVEPAKIIEPLRLPYRPIYKEEANPKVRQLVNTLLKANDTKGFYNTLTLDKKEGGSPYADLAHLLGFYRVEDLAWAIQYGKPETVVPPRTVLKKETFEALLDKIQKIQQQDPNAWQQYLTHLRAQRSALTGKKHNDFGGVDLLGTDG